MARHGEETICNVLVKMQESCFLTSECGLQAKTVPETAQAAFEKTCKGLGLSRISKIRFCRFHRVFRFANIKTIKQHVAGMKNHATPWEKTESPKSIFAGPSAFHVVFVGFSVSASGAQT